MTAVSNTSPLSKLAIIGRLDVLRQQYLRIHIPAAVLAELEALPTRKPSNPSGRRSEHGSKSHPPPTPI
jgi:predicted nucleic acid-binding protein